MAQVLTEVEFRVYSLLKNIGIGRGIDTVTEVTVKDKKRKIVIVMAKRISKNRKK